MSIDTLKQAVDLDARMINFLQTDSGFDGIRDRPEFMGFVESLTPNEKQPSHCASIEKPTILC